MGHFVREDVGSAVEDPEEIGMLFPTELSEAVSPFGNATVPNTAGEGRLKCATMDRVPVL